VDHQVINKNKMKQIIFLLIISISFSCKQQRERIIPPPERIIPQPPFIIIEYEPFEYGVSNDGVRYKTIDKNGYVFYFSENVRYGEYPRYNLGDTIK
jgi:hypothetical protein